MKHIVMFSGGAASSKVGQMIAQQYPDNTILLHTPTGAEHSDADRFRDQVARFIGLPITVESAKSTLWEYIERRKHIANDSFPWCREVVKLDPQERFLKNLEKQGIDFTVYIGFGFDEWRRIQRTSARYAVKDRNVRFPLFDARLKGSHCKEIVLNKWGICLPETYKYLKHNNCIPCYRGGARTLV